MASQVTGLREARAASLALRSVDREVRSDINKQVRSVVTPVWKGEVESRAATPMDKTVLAKGVRVASGTSPTLVAASSSRVLSGGLKPSEDYRAFEFGANRNEKTTYSATSKKGKRYQVTRRTKRQLPTNRKSGRVLHPAVAEMGPRVMALWTQTAIRRIIEAFKEGE